MRTRFSPIQSRVCCQSGDLPEVLRLRERENCQAEVRLADRPDEGRGEKNKSCGEGRGGEWRPAERKERRDQNIKPDELLQFHVQPRQPQPLRQRVLIHFLQVAVTVIHLNASPVIPKFFAVSAFFAVKSIPAGRTRGTQA